MPSSSSPRPARGRLERAARSDERPPRPAPTGMRPAPGRRSAGAGRATRAATELAAALAAVAIAAGVMTWLSGTERAQLLYRDADSVLPILMLRSLAAGEVQDWALSPVLFAPELALVAVPTLLGAGPVLALWSAGALQFALLYGVLRYVAGSTVADSTVADSTVGDSGFAGDRQACAGGAAGRGTGIGSASTGRAGRAPWTALAGTALYALLAATNTSDDRSSLELPSLLGTTTYYSTTLLASLLVIGAAARFVRDGRPAPLALASAVTALGVLCNPLLGAWAVAPVAVAAPLLLLLRDGQRMHKAGRRTQRTGRREHRTDERMRGPAGGRGLPPWQAVGLLLGALGAAAALGLALRLPLGKLFALDGSGYARPERWLDSLQGFAAMLEPTPASVVAALLLLAAATACALGLRAGRRRGDAGLALLGLVGLLGPALVLLGAVALGADAPRYLQPIAFLPLLGVAALAAAPGRTARAAAPVVAALATVALLLTTLLAVPPVLARAADDPDADCVTAWIGQADAVGAGQFWTVRYPKSRLADPSALVQVTHELRAYAWMVNRADFAAEEVGFLLVDAQSTVFELPPGATEPAAIGCGRFTILELAEPIRLR